MWGQLSWPVSDEENAEISGVRSTASTRDFLERWLGLWGKTPQALWELAQQVPTGAYGVYVGL